MARPTSLIPQLVLLSLPLAATAAPREPEGNSAPECVDSLDLTIGHTDRQVVVYADELCRDVDGDRIIIDSLQDADGDEPVRGRHFSHLRLPPNVGHGTFTITMRDTWRLAPPVTVTVTRDNAAPSCPEDLMVRDGDTVDLGALGFSDPDGDTITIDAVQVSNGDGSELLFSDAPEGSLPLPETRSFLDELGLALPTLRVAVSDDFGGHTTCRFPIDPPDDVVCNGTLERTQFDPDRPLVIDPADDCVSLDGNDDRFTVRAISTADGAPVEWYSDRVGNPTVMLPPGEHALSIQTAGAGALDYTAYVGEFLPPLAGETNVLAEDGGEILLAPLVRAVEAETGNPDDPTDFDPLTPVKVSLIAPDLSTLAESDGGDVLSTGLFSTSSQGLQQVGPKLLMTLKRDDGSLIERSFEVPVNRAPRCRASGSATYDEDGTVFVPDSWCVDSEGSRLTTVSVRSESGEEVGFEQTDGGLSIQARDYVPPHGFTIVIRDDFRSQARASDGNGGTIGTGTFTITSRDEFDAL